MGFLSLLLLSLPLSLVNSCLVIQYPVTSTPEPFCGCPFRMFNATNIAQSLPQHKPYEQAHSFDHDGPFYQPIRDPIASGDECFQSLSCPTHYKLVINQDRAFKTFTNELSAMCDPYSQQWLVDDGIHEIETFSYINVTCVRFDVCPCFGGSTVLHIMI